MTVGSGGTPRTSLSRRSRRLVGIALTLPAFLLAALLVLPGAATAGEGGGPDLTVTMSDNIFDPVPPGGTVTFNIHVSNSGSGDSFDTHVSFTTTGASVISAGDTADGNCTWEGTSASCDLGLIPTSSLEQVVVDVEAPDTPGTVFQSTATASSTDQTDELPADNSDTETTTVEEGSDDSDAGPIPPGGSLSTVQGTPGNPASPDDPFALELTNVSGQPLVGSIDEEDCDGTQAGDPLCSQPRLGGKAGDFRFSPSGGIALRLLAPAAAPVTVAKLFYDRTLVRQADGVRIFYQKASDDPVIRLSRCDDGRRTECFRVKKLASGDQIVRVPLKDDPRITRG